MFETLIPSKSHSIIIADIYIEYHKPPGFALKLTVKRKENKHRISLVPCSMYMPQTTDNSDCFLLSSKNGDLVCFVEKMMNEQTENGRLVRYEEKYKKGET